MDIISVCVISVFASVCAAALRKYNAETASMLMICAAVMLSVLSLPFVSSAFEALNELMSTAKIKNEYASALIKALGVCFVTQISVNVCRENGASAVASQLEIAGKLIILIPSLPIFIDLLRTIGEFIR
ncbi:MAG: stage III sporulation protein AD [Clostridia bacterium]|nr:stage III sporulation protein AD [Clostridia bacterium]MBQ2152730.1 stage III sporulation protein AD [Clostridia bacterium]